MGSQHRYLDRETQSSMNKSFSFLLFLHLILHRLSSSTTSALRFPRRIGNKNHYNFAYQVEDSSEGLNYRARESSNGKVVQGEYSVRLPGGRVAEALKGLCLVTVEGQGVVTAMLGPTLWCT